MSFKTFRSKHILAAIGLFVMVGLATSQGLSCRGRAEPYCPYGGGLVAGFVLGFDVYDELVPIAWASIIATTLDSQVVAVTSSLGAGYFEMFLPVGFYNLTVEEYGFVSNTIQIFVSSGSSTTLQFILEQGQNTYPVTVNIAGFSSHYYSNLRVDGRYAGILSGDSSRTLRFRLGTRHRLDIDPYVTGPSGIRYHSTFVNWTVTDNDSMTFTYRPEYYLRVDRGRADFPSVEGWYDESTLVKVPSAPEYANATAAVRCIFDYWMVDGGKVPGNPISVVMDKPHNISTRYRTQYYVDVMSEFDNPTGSGWYDTNSTANISVTTPQGFGVQKVFDGWEGDGVSKSPTISILVDSPKTLTAVWHDDYTQAYTGIVMIVAAVSVLLTVLVRPRKKAESKTEPKT